MGFVIWFALLIGLQDEVPVSIHCSFLVELGRIEGTEAEDPLSTQMVVDEVLKGTETEYGESVELAVSIAVT